MTERDVSREGEGQGTEVPQDAEEFLFDTDAVQQSSRARTIDSIDCNTIAYYEKL
jgi:hypothetical protein